VSLLPFRRIIVTALALAMPLAACSKQEGPPPRATATAAPTAAVKPTPSAILTRQDLDKLSALVGPSLAASWRDVFGQEPAAKVAFDVETKGPVALVRVTGLSRLVDCQGTLTTSGGGTVPYNCF
jgi:hypothetical protein